MGRPAVLITSIVCPNCAGPKYRYAQTCFGCRDTASIQNGMFGKKHTTMAKELMSRNHPKHIAAGSANGNWRGDSVKLQAGRTRALRAFVMPELCESCRCVPPRDRHHVDANTLNNDRSNILFLCRRCHQIIDGRYESLKRNPYRGSKVVLYGKRTTA